MIGNKKTRSFASFGKGRREAPWNPNGHLTYNFSTFLIDTTNLMLGMTFVPLFW
jgi:hypothetical protein